MIEKDLTGDTQARARAAYLAIALDLAFSIKQSSPDQWQKAAAALLSYNGLMQVLFYDSPGEPGRLLRERAALAGVEQPPRATP